jgi:probable HAF family extracellular repeat protein
MFTLVKTGISGKLLKSILCLALTLSPLALTAQNSNQYAYVANEKSGQVFGYLLNATHGNLTPLHGSPFPTVDCGLISIAVDPAGRFLYAAGQQAGSDKNVVGFRIDRPTGRLTPIQGSPFTAGGSPSAIAIDPSGRFAYVSNFGASKVSAFKIDQSTGELLSIASYPAGTDPDAVTVDPLGKFVYVANQSSNDVSGYAINQATGALTQITGSPFPTGTSPVSLAVDPNERFVYVANHGSDNIWGYTINGSSGALAALGSSPYAVGDAGVSSVVVAPAGANVYVAAYGGIYAYSINQNITAVGFVGGDIPINLYGQLTPIQGSPFGGGSPDFVTVDYTGTFVYAANKSSNDISGFMFSNSDLKPLSASPYPAGWGPVSVALVRPQTFPVFTATSQFVPFTGLGSVVAFDAAAINDLGQVAGTVSSSEGGEPFTVAFLYAGGVTNPVAFLNRTSTGNGLNDKGQVVGQQNLTPPLQVEPPPQAFLYSYSNKTTINIDNVLGRESDAYSINNAGQVTGWLSTGTCPTPFSPAPTCLGNTHAFLYTGAGLADIGTLGGTYSEGTSINNLGEIAGISTVTNGATHLFLYTQGHMHDLGTASGQTFVSAALNDRGEILASTAGSGGVGVSYLYRNNTFFKLPFPGSGINNSTEIVGTKPAATAVSRAYLYFGGISIDLNELVDPSLPLLTSASGVSNNGKIVATGLNGQLYVLTPK